MKLHEQVLDSYIHEMVNINEMQLGFVPGRGTTGSIFVVRQLQEKYIAANKLRYFAVVDPVSIMFQGRSYGGPYRSHRVEEWAVRVIQGMYSNAQRSMQVNNQCNYEFGMGVHVHQDSALSPLLLVPVLEALSHEFSIRVPWELLHNDDLLLITNTQEECISKLKAWKADMESRELHVNMKKTKYTKFLVSGVGHAVVKKSGKYPCAACSSGVGNNSIQCSQCMWWVHKKCSGITKQLVAASNHVCRRCKGEARPIIGRTVDVDGTMLDVEATFYYLCDILYSGAIAARCCVAR